MFNRYKRTPTWPFETAELVILCEAGWQAGMGIQSGVYKFPFVQNGPVVPTSDRPVVSLSLQV